MSKPKIMMTRGVLIYSFFLFTYILCFSQEYEKNIELSSKIKNINKNSRKLLNKILRVYWNIIEKDVKIVANYNKKSKDTFKGKELGTKCKLFVNPEFEKIFVNKTFKIPATKNFLFSLFLFLRIFFINLFISEYIF